MSSITTIATRAEKLIEDGRCHPIAVVPRRAWVGIIEGYTGRYLTTVVHHGVISAVAPGSPLPPSSSCTCEAARNGIACYHVAAGFLLLLRPMP